ncbi:hypothetical protein M426DRAFT_57542 [Hypoxylon sp. CI-4A]|nr:hypothetical protein M426DRAFT_57542 [Hypoxylon sp. CI-4A]
MYNIFFHPLKNYPGPVLAKVTDAYAGFHALRMRLNLTTWEDHRKYGRIIRHGPNKLIFNSAEALKDIYLHERVSKSWVYLTTLGATTGENIWSTTDKRVHRQRQRMVGSILNDISLQRFEPTMIREIDTLLKVILSACRAPRIQYLDMSRQFNYLSLDIIGQLSFGYANNTLTRPKNRFLTKGIMMNNYHYNVFMQFPSLAKSWLVSLMHRLMARQEQRNLESLKKAIRRRTSQGLDAKYDLYHVVTKQANPADDEDIEQSDMWSEAALFYVAGHETSATTMSAMLFYLSRNKECYHKLASEIRSAFANGADIRKGSVLAGCKYLRACIDETLRMSPPLSGTLWREATRDDSMENGPLVIDGHLIPPGTQIGVCTYAIHHNEEYFPEPFVFKPERWTTDITAGRPSPAFAPFSLGPRSCAGKSLAYQEISITVAKILWYFDFERPAGNLGNIGAGKPGGRGVPEEFRLYDILTSTHNGPVLSFRTRGELWKELATMENGEAVS